MTDRFRLVGSLALAALVAGGAYRAGARLPELGIDRSPLKEHVEAAAKRARFEAAARARALTGAVPPSVEGTDRGLDVLSYDISFDVDPAIRFLSGTTVIRVAGFAPRTTSLALDLDDAFTVTASTRDGLDVTATHAGDKLVIPFEPPLGATDRATLSVSYRGVPPAASALDFWQHAGGWAATSVAEPFLARTFWPCVDDPKDKAVATLHATVPAGYVAASAGAVSVADAGGGRKMPIRSYLLPEYAEGNVARLSEIKNHIATQASMFGEYPFLDTKYGIVAASFPGGMEHPTLTSIGSSILANASRDITTLLVHELTHDWWSDRVTMRTWDDIWLNEGFATYGEVLYLEKALGFAPGSTLATSYDDGLYGGRLAPAVVADPADPFKNTGAVYYKGARALHMLRRLVGDATFFPALRATYRTSADASTVTLAVTQTQGHTVVHPAAGPHDKPFYVFPLPVRITDLDGTTYDVILDLDGVTTSVTLPNPSKKFVAGIQLDPGSDILKIVESTGPG